ncbi:hypothetical protein [Nocardioides daejeonensis]|uniref:hypothetical protein n=1 Tax=Nocardioides daejeonensis TaxID=1046556 RepID=UPI000D74602B|nr:hypothetical protein [Nocardioides daejeonensis]
MGANEESGATEQPQLGLLDQWLAHHSDGDEKPVPEPRRTPALADESAVGEQPTPSIAQTEVASAKDRLAAARREKERREAQGLPTTPPVASPAVPTPTPDGGPEPDPVLMAKLAALRAEPPVGGVKDRLAAKRAEHAETQRDVGAEILGALGATPPEPEPVASGSEADPHEPGSGDVPVETSQPAVADALSAPIDPLDALRRDTAEPPASQAVDPAPERTPPPSDPSPGLPDADARRERLARMVQRRQQAATDISPAAGATSTRSAAEASLAPEVAPAAQAAPGGVGAPEAPAALVGAAAETSPAESTPSERRNNGKHKADIPVPPPTEDVDGSMDPALQGALRAVEAAEAAAAADTGRGKSRWKKRPSERPQTAPEPEPAREEARPAFPPAPEPTPITETDEAIALDPAVAAALEAGLSSQRKTERPRSKGAPKPATATPPAEATADDLLTLVTRSADEARARREAAQAAVEQEAAPDADESATSTIDGTAGASDAEETAADDAATASPATVDSEEADPEEDAAVQDGSTEETASPTAQAEADLPPLPPVVEPLVAAEAAIAETTTPKTARSRPANPAQATTTVAASPKPANPVAPAAREQKRAEERREPLPVARKDDLGLRVAGRPEAGAPTSPKAPPGVVRFSPRRSTRKLLGMLLLLSAAGAVGTGLLANDTRGTTEIAIAGTLGLMTLILWSAFSTAEPAKLSIDRGVLDISSKESRHRFDLASPYTEVTVKGVPGKRSWQVQIHRRSMKPFVIDSSMVDPEEFQPVLEYYRELAEEQAEETERRRGR